MATFPTDAALPGLNLLVRQRELIGILSAFLPGWTGADTRIAGCRAKVCRHVPGKRCIVALEVRIHSERSGTVEYRKLIAKAYANDQGEEVYARLHDLENHGFAQSPLTVTKPLAYVTGSRLLILHHSNGEQLRNLILTQPNLESCMESAAEWLAKLHRCGVTGGRRYSLQRHLFALAARRQNLQQVAPELARQFMDILAQIETYSGDSYIHSVLGPTHRDFSPDHLLVDGLQFTGLDFDEFCQYDSLFDVAHFIAHVAYLGLLHCGSLHHFASLGDRFSSAYEECIRNRLPMRMKLYLALSYLKLVQIVALVTLPPQWQQMTDTLLKQARQFAKGN